MTTEYAQSHDSQPSRVTPFQDTYQRVTDTIIRQLEQGTKPWRKPWNCAEGWSRIPLRSTGEPYRGINTLLLWCSASERGYPSPYWMTLKQANQLNARIRKGEKGNLVVYANAIQKTVENADGEEEERTIPYLKSYTVFNAEQIEGLPENYSPQFSDPLDPNQRLQQADRFFEQTQAEIRHGGERAYYKPSEDYIQMPSFEAFHSSEAYAGVLAHELIHWTGHSDRLARELKYKQWGDASYALEELVAELGSAFLGAILEIEPAREDDRHAAYLQHWLKVLREDKRAIVRIASQAQKAVDYLRNLQPQTREQTWRESA